MKRDREEIVAAAFAAAGFGASFDPIRVQKLLFLIDRVASAQIGGPFFDFQPYHYGPFDRAVYGVIEAMAEAGDVQIDASEAYHMYSLTRSGHRRGGTTIASFPAPVADYFERAARWVRLVPYRYMLAAIYREYPEMAENSVVGHLGKGRDASGENPFICGVTRALDLTGTMYRMPDSEVGLQSDADALHEDWCAVGAYIEDAMVQIGESECIW